MEGRPAPSLPGIQRLNAILVVAAAGLLLMFVSPAASLSCFLGGAVVMANLMALEWLGRLMVAAAARRTASALSLIALPLKLLLAVGLLYLAFYRKGIDGIGFGVGVSTQFVAIVAETARVSLRARGGTLTSEVGKR